MHLYIYEAECGEQYECESDQSVGPGRFLYCDFCHKWQLFSLIEHIEIQD